jgi:hypothetical protein
MAPSDTRPRRRLSLIRPLILLGLHIRPGPAIASAINGLAYRCDPFARARGRILSLSSLSGLPMAAVHPAPMHRCEPALPRSEVRCRNTSDRLDGHRRAAAATSRSGLAWARCRNLEGRVEAGRGG